jgi:hypothetical protein
LKKISVRVEGGSIGQLIGLAMALAIKKRYKREFEIIYHNKVQLHTSGFQLRKFLSSEEQIVVIDEIKKNHSIIVQGRFFDKIPVKIRFIAKPLRMIYQKLLFIKAKLRSYSLMNSQKERTTLFEKIPGEKNYIDRITPEIDLIRGVYWPGLIASVYDELSERFDSAQVPNPLIPPEETLNRIVIHYRLGDMRTERRWQMSHGVIDPNCLLEMVNRIRKSAKDDLPAYIFSDEIDVARSIFATLQPTKFYYSKRNDVWTDLKDMVNSTHFIGSFSQVSAVVAQIRFCQGLQNNYLPKNRRLGKIKRTSRQEGVNYFRTRILPLDDAIYSMS